VPGKEFNVLMNAAMSNVEEILQITVEGVRRCLFGKDVDSIGVVNGFNGHGFIDDEQFERLWENKFISMFTKLKLMKAVECPVATCGCVSVYVDKERR